jgi:NCS2 family nucleobase:cation symporter-2
MREEARFIGLDEKVPLAKSAVYGLQHIIAMFAGVVAVPLIVGGAIDLSPAQKTILVQGALIASGIGTILQTGRVFILGARFPVCMGTAFVFITPMISIGNTYGVSAIFGALIVGGIVEFIVSTFIWRIKRFFPPLVTSTVVTLIGLGLIPVGFNWAVGSGTPFFAQPIAFIIAGLVLVIMIVANRFTTGFIQTICIIFAIVCGYIISALFGVLDMNYVLEAKWVALPKFFAFGWPQFKLGAILGILAAQFGSMLETVGDIYATGTVLNEEVKKENLQGAVAVDGIASSIATIFNGFSLTSFSQNIGVIGITRVGSRHVVRIGGIILVIMGLFPKFAAIITAMPAPVLGGVGIVMFGSVAAAGVGQLAGIKLTPRELLIFATAIGLGLGFGLASGDALANLPKALQIILHSGVVVGAIVAILLNEVIPKRQSE